MIKISKNIYECLLEINPKIVSKTKNGYYLLGKNKEAKAKKLKDSKA